MHHNLTNFLPSDRIRALRMEYWTRLGALTLFGLALVVTAHALLMVPTYLYVIEEHAALETHLEDLIRTNDTDARAAYETRAAALRADAERLLAHASGATVSTALARLLAVPHSGISLSAFTIDAGQGNERKVRLTGIASSRNALHEYHQALLALPGITAADLPLSSYAKDADIPFTILLSGTLLP